MRKFKFCIAPKEVVETEEVFEFGDNISSNELLEQLTKWAVLQAFDVSYEEVKDDE